MARKYVNKKSRLEIQRISKKLVRVQRVNKDGKPTGPHAFGTNVARAVIILESKEDS